MPTKLGGRLQSVDGVGSRNHDSDDYTASSKSKAMVGYTLPSGYPEYVTDYLSYACGDQSLGRQLWDERENLYTLN